ncbi:MAG: hypothetical protein NWE89_08740 [Candidatus Bathyarchaeota archaeon]|nr:hypothetical protein [Candidatus Bathyarchaeota archaeon]
MEDKNFEDALGEFTLKESGRPETGDVLGVWIIVDQTPIFFHPQESRIEKLYRDPVQDTLL